MKQRPVIIAHRGASGLTGEDNTLYSFERAIDIGCDFVEFDVRRTRDNILVCFHDPGINGIPVDRLSYQDLNMEAGIAVPTLEETVEMMQGRIKLDIDLKEEGYEEEVLDIITSRFELEGFLVKSFYDSIIQNVTACNPDVKAGLLIGPDDVKGTSEAEMKTIRKRLELCGCRFISPQVQLYRKGLFAYPEFSEYETYIWTVNTPEETGEAISFDVTGIISDYPDIVINSLTIAQTQKVKRGSNT